MDKYEPLLSTSYQKNGRYILDISTNAFRQ